MTIKKNTSKEAIEQWKNQKGSQPQQFKNNNLKTSFAEVVKIIINNTESNKPSQPMDYPHKLITETN